MRYANVTALNAISANSTTASDAEDASYLMKVSAQVVSAGSSILGTAKLQSSNDKPPAGESPVQFTPTNWVDIPSASATITTAGAQMIAPVDVCFQYIRALFTDTGAGVQTVQPIADTGVALVQTIQPVADVAGSLNSKWFAINSVNATSKALKAFYVWLDNGSGVDPAPAGKTAIHVTYTNGDTAAAIGGFIATALAALSNDFASATGTTTVTVTNAKPGNVAAASDGTAPTAFTFGVSTAGVNSNLNNKYFLLNSANDATAYYVWFNVASLGTAPAPAGKTAIAVACNAAASAATIGGLMATAIAAANASADFTATGTTTVTVTNKVVGPYTAASDFNTGFTIAITTPSGTVTVNVKTIGF